jgi:glycosyl transferase family 25
MHVRQKNIFEQINDYFDYIYILTIERAIERHKKIDNNLNGLNYSFFYGIDKMNLNIDDLIKSNLYDDEIASKKNRYHKSMKVGEIACSMGHKAIYEHAIQNNYQKILILEDDVISNEEGVKQFSQIMKQLPANWDILYFDYFKNEHKNFFTYSKQIVYHIQKILGLLKWSHTTVNNLFASKYSANLKKAGYHDFASAYAITLNAAKILLHLQTPIVFPADHLLPFAITNNILTGFISMPKVFLQQSQSNKSIIGSYVEE